MIFGKGSSPPCPCCSAPIHKSSACNEMRHCGLCRCNVCGELAPPGQDVLVDHWIGMGGSCPRFDQHTYWDLFTPEWKCVEGECHDEHRDCCVPAHDEGIGQYHGHRKIRHFLTAVRSLPATHQADFITRLVALGQARDRGPTLINFVHVANWVDGMLGVL